MSYHVDNRILPIDLENSLTKVFEHLYAGCATQYEYILQYVSFPVIKALVQT